MFGHPTTFDFALFSEDGKALPRSGAVPAAGSGHVRHEKDMEDVEGEAADTRGILGALVLAAVRAGRPQQGGRGQRGPDRQRQQEVRTLGAQRQTGQ